MKVAAIFGSLLVAWLLVYASGAWPWLGFANFKRSSFGAGNITIDRYGADECIRNDLNSWAAWLEIHAGPHADRLMQHLIGSQQIITLRVRDEADEALRRLLQG